MTPASRPYRSIGAGLAADARRGLTAATGGLLGLAVVELVATLIEYSGPLRAGAVARFIPLEATLIAMLWVVVAPVVALLFVIPRLAALVMSGRDAARALPGPGALPIDGKTVAHGWVWVAALSLFVYWSANATYRATHQYKEFRLMGMLLAIRQVAMLLVLWLGARGLAPTLDRLRRWTDRKLGRWRVLSPLGHPVPALLLAMTFGIIALVLTGSRLPQFKPLIPWRWMLAGAAMLVGAGVALQLGRRRPLLPIERARRRRFAWIAAASALVIVPLTLVRFGGHPDAKYMAITGSPVLSRLVEWVRKANDFDGDGFGSLLGENDCAPFDQTIGPGARDQPDNGIDENCDGRDPSLRDLIAPVGDRMPVPEAYRRDWNILLITVDTVRYDHTSFGGYRDGAKARDTTPRLAELVDQAVSFTFANAPSAGTMASVPAILTSKFFHSGIALDENRKPKMPPKLKPENTTLPEIMKRRGYRTGAILSHEYFNDWGMQQGVDDYDNSIGKKPDAFRVSSDQTTDQALAWVSRHARDKWFLWLHYLDPHGRYVAHPGGQSWGTSEEDLYDGELHFTDAHLGRLFDELKRLPNASNTIIIVTSDHGDAFNEHGFTNHGQDLYRELLHVPLIFYVPDLPARQLGGAVTPLDIVPTVADLCGIDVTDLTFEGRSLVPQIFYGKEDLERVVFAETNYPKPLRAAVSARYKLIYDLQNNLNRLFKLDVDPQEKTNIATKDPQALADMKLHLDAWLQRVMFARDPLYNQATTKVAGVLLAGRPTPGHPIEGTSFDGGRIELLGWDLDPVDGKYAPGDKLYAHVYFAVQAPPSGNFKLQMSGWLVQAAGFDPRAAVTSKVTRSPMRVTAEGYLPTDAWRGGEFIRERFGIVIPADWANQTGDGVALGVVFAGSEGKVDAAGQVATSDSALAVLGVAPLVRPPPPAPPTGPDGGIPGIDAGIQPRSPRLDFPGPP